MNHEIFLSCVIPVYGAEKYLGKCFDSILLSPYAHMVEVIAINDGSPDGSAAILDEYASKYSNFIAVHQANIGGAPTINKGLHLAKGQYVAIIDNDDWLSEDAIGIFYRYVMQYQDKNVDVVATHVIKQWASKNEIVHDVKYISSLETVVAHKKPAIMNDGMYLGKIFRKAFLQDKSIIMEPTLLYADRPFVANAMACAKHILLVPEVTYYWRQREDSNNLSITDNMYSLDNLSDRIRSIRIMKFDLKSKGYDYWLNTIDYFNCHRIFWAMNTKSNNINYLRNFARVTKPYFSEINLEKVTNLSDEQKFIVQTIRDYSHEEFALLYLKRKLLNNVNQKYTSLFKKRILGLLSQHSENKLKHIALNEDFDQQLVVFESNFGKSYSGNPKYIYEELLRQKRSMRVVWVYQGREKLKDIPGNVVQVHRGTPEYFNYLARAGYWVNNIRFTVTYKPKNTVYLQTWHGTPLKRLGLDIEVSGPEAEARESFLKESRNWDYLLAQNEYSRQIFKRAFDVQGEVLVHGYPADDVLLSISEDLADKIKSKIGLPKEKKVVLYAPTWRDDARKGSSWEYTFDLKMDFETMRAELSSDYVVLLRLHHLIADRLDLSGFEDFIFDVSHYDDTTEILAISDLLITDYSSIFFDYMTTKKPVLFYMYDLDVYQTKLRGFYLNVYNDLPGPIIDNFNDLLIAIKNVESLSRIYSEKYQQLYEVYCGKQTDSSAKLIVDKVFKKLPK